MLWLHKNERSIFELINTSEYFIYRHVMTVYLQKTMKTILKASIAFIVLFAISCSKEINNKQSMATPVSANALAADTVHYIGEKYGGGIVYYVDNTGKHGFIAAIANQSAGITWNKDGINIS